MAEKDYSVHGTYPVSLVIESRTKWHPTDTMLDIEEIALIAFVGAERCELATAEISGYEASQRPEHAIALLLKGLVS